MIYITLVAFNRGRGVKKNGHFSKKSTILSEIVKPTYICFIPLSILFKSTVVCVFYTFNTKTGQKCDIALIFRPWNWHRKPKSGISASVKFTRRENRNFSRNDTKLHLSSFHIKTSDMDIKTRKISQYFKNSILGLQVRLHQMFFHRPPL